MLWFCLLVLLTFSLLSSISFSFIFFCGIAQADWTRRKDWLGIIILRVGYVLEGLGLDRPDGFEGEREGEKLKKRGCVCVCVYVSGCV